MLPSISITLLFVVLNVLAAALTVLLGFHIHNNAPTTGKFLVTIGFSYWLLRAIAVLLPAGLNIYAFAVILSLGYLVPTLLFTSWTFGLDVWIKNKLNLMQDSPSS